MRSVARMMNAVFMVMSLTVMPAQLVSAQDRSANPLPNIVIIYADDLGYGDLGCYGGQPSVTPNLDRLAEQGARFTDFYSAQPVCSASRAALLTGCYPNRVSIAGALSPAQHHGLNHNEVTFAKLVKQKDYATAIYGKWHMGHHPNFLPATFGFDDYLGIPYSNDMGPVPMSDPRYEGKKHLPPIPLIEGTKTIATEPDQSQLTTWYTERAVKFIETNRQRPFLLYVPHSMPHVPIYVSNKFAGKTGRGVYYDVIAEIDWSVGQIVDTLERLGLSRNTLVVFSSDNGPWKLYGNHGGSAGPLRESKATVYEGGIRVPCIARWPGKIAEKTVIKQPAIMMDWFPTISHLTGAKLPDHPIDGKDLWRLLTTPDAPAPHESLFFYYRNNELQAMRSGRWKMLFPHDVVSTEDTTLGIDGLPGRNSKRKIDVELYDLTEDPGEQKNLVSSKPDIVSGLTKQADAMREELGDALQKKTGKANRPYEEFPKGD